MSMSQRYLGPYELRQRLSSTHQYESWKAWDRQQQREVEITILHLQEVNASGFMSRFFYETKNLTILNHPSIAKIYEVQVFPSTDLAEQTDGFGAGNACIVREYIDGMSLADYIDATSRGGDFPALADIYHILAPICSALDYAHQHGIIHSRLKPTHILFTRPEGKMQLRERQN
ncbi:serine/threonine protein kinase [Dictyobacter kobayashii]|uniref:Protein kinase domain-containing protein n=1 Tax=Dictyobacter kobayashii TaxID=2014872 RepID=A0A402AFK2_9CHLR|nr:protein kinase [Dictyobacter kobayashii]GCE17879.1 hypothetical protein KDK_16790 [Dictyobacter kobayashii]